MQPDKNVDEKIPTCSQAGFTSPRCFLRIAKYDSHQSMTKPSGDAVGGGLGKRLDQICLFACTGEEARSRTHFAGIVSVLEAGTMFLSALCSYKNLTSPSYWNQNPCFLRTLHIYTGVTCE
jgi:hypothetical protein